MSKSIDYNSLHQLARSQKPEDREALANNLISLLREDLTEGEEFLVQDILVRMLREAETELRHSMATYLAEQRKCPQGLVDFLVYNCAFEECEPLLRDAEYLSESFLVDVGRRFESKKYWETLASRKKIGSNLAQYLISVNDIDIHKKLLDNLSCQLCQICMTDLTEIAIKVTEIQHPLLYRPEMTAPLAARLYWYVSELLKGDIQRRFNVDKQMLDGAMLYSVSQNVNRRATVRTIPMELLGLVRKIPQLSRQEIIDGMKKNDRAYFACLVGTYFKINPEEILFRLEAQSGLTMALICKAINLTHTQFSQLYLSWMHASSEKIIDGKELNQALYMYNQLKPQKATDVIASWQKTMPMPVEEDSALAS